MDIFVSSSVARSRSGKRKGFNRKKKNKKDEKMDPGKI